MLSPPRPHGCPTPPRPTAVCSAPGCESCSVCPAPELPSYLVSGLCALSGSAVECHRGDLPKGPEGASLKKQDWTCAMLFLL